MPCCSRRKVLNTQVWYAGRLFNWKLNDHVHLQCINPIKSPLRQLLKIVGENCQWVLQPCSYSSVRLKPIACDGTFTTSDLLERCSYVSGRQCLYNHTIHTMQMLMWRIWSSPKTVNHVWRRHMNFWHTWCLTKFYLSVLIRVWG